MAERDASATPIRDFDFVRYAKVARRLMKCDSIDLLRADDVVIEALLALRTPLENPHATEEPLIVHKMRHVIADACRRQRAERNALERSTSSPAARASCGDSVHYTIRMALSDLRTCGTKPVDVVVARLLARGFTSREIADRLSMTPVAIRQRVSRLRRQIVRKWASGP